MTGAPKRSHGPGRPARPALAGRQGPDVFVLGALARDVDAIVRAAVSQGFAATGPRLHDLDGGLAARLAPLWRGETAQVPVAVVVHSPPACVVAHLVRGGRRTEAVALALWERTLRRALESVEGLSTLVVRPGPSAAAELRRFLGNAAPAGRAGADRAAANRRLVTPSLAPAQSRLDAVLDGLVGVHRPFEAIDLPPESPPTESLVAADRCFELQRAALEAGLARAVAAVEALGRPVPPVAPPFEQGYGPDAGEDDGGYALWLDREPARGRAGRPAGGVEPPTIAVVVAVHRPGAVALERCVASVAAQTYPRWQLHLAPVGPAVTAAGGGTVVGGAVADLVATDPRITIGAVGGDSASAVNAVASVIDASFLAFVEQDDELAPGALAAVGEALADDPEIDLLYTDEDEIDGDGRRCRPRFKPDWSPDLLESTMYVGGLLVVRRSLFAQVGGLAPAFEGAEHYDLVLRVGERARRVAHVAEVAYHRRSPAPAPVDASAVSAAEGRALESALARRGERATVEPGLCARSHRVRREIVGQPLVSIIVPFRDGAGLLRRCVDSLHATAGYDHWELVLIDNQSWEPETAALLRRLRGDARVRLVSYPHPYNWSALNNFGARHSAGDMLLLLNSDVEGLASGWLSAMVEHAQRPEVGAVGARLLYPDGSIQHGGVVMGLGANVAWHAFWKCPGDHDGYLGHARMVRNYSVVTGACMLVRRDAFDAVGGLDESLAILFNDVELCLRMRAKGLRVVYTPYAELVHYESKTRGFTAEQDEVTLMRGRWPDAIARDPYFNPNLDIRRADFALPR